MDKPTDKQITAIANMCRALGWKFSIPDSKKDASDIIGKMKGEIKNRLAAIGTMNYFHEDDYGGNPFNINE